MIVIKKSKIGFVAASLFLCLAAGVFGWLLHSVHTNLGDSGEGGVLLLPFIFPWWFLLLSLDVNLQWFLPVMLLFNAFIIYCVFGG